MKNHVQRTVLRLCLAAVAAAPGVAADLQLEAGTPVLLALKSDLAPASVKVGKKIEFTVVDDVKLQDVVVIRKGATAWGIVKDPKQLKKQSAEGRIGVSLENVEMANGAKAPIREDPSDVEQQGAGSKIVGGVGSTSKTIGKISTGGLLFKGKKAVTIPADARMRAVIKGVVLIDPADFPRAPSSPGAAPPVQEAVSAVDKLTNEDIILLKNQGFSDDILLAKIHASSANFKTGPNDLIELKKAGVSESVIRAMIETQK